ncbi:hypothetical protein NP233_g8437 [Leucocoprinus birnbaumii]|uniref:CxC2-like cysteine cluster KDZ transposase-associated domain-containing protein n=1 Tax=Leucocoprinus birnbaumii TaxID=56174 RepID=A0AAD5VMF7_9AGAR|nr:hypothetical protein NP233_g8437 [Leucocoprinus birnbaumii]
MVSKPLYHVLTYRLTASFNLPVHLYLAMAQKRKNPHVYKEDDKPSHPELPMHLENIRLVSTSKAKRTRHHIITNIVPTEGNALSSSSSPVETHAVDVPNERPSGPVDHVQVVMPGDASHNHPHSTEENPVDEETRSGPEAESIPSRKSAYAKIKSWEPLFEALQRCFIKLEAEPAVGNAYPRCSTSNPALYRCAECLTGVSMCQNCIVSRHIHHPLHRIQQWTGTHFTDTSLRQLGLVVYIGHRGQPCPSSTYTQDMIVIHVNGVHSCAVQYCDCDDLIPNYQQLMLARYFPATSHTPCTAFTFSVLESFHQLSLCSKITAYDYYDSLKKLTNHAFPQRVEDRYKELMEIMQIWRRLVEDRRSGQVVAIDIEFPLREPGSLALRCPACPEPGFNVSLEVLANAPPELKHTLTLFLALDGNYRLNQKFKNSDRNDVPLNKGKAYFVDNVAFEEYLKLHDDGATQNSTCSKLKAVRQQQMIKFSDTVYSGVVATQCRHGTYVRNGMVNLVRGETIESAWSEQNHAAGSTKEQSTGHRQDTLDDFNSYWNWTKVHRMSKHLLSQLIKYWNELQEQNEIFTKLTARFSNDVVKEWEEMWVVAEEKADKEMDLKGKEDTKISQRAANKKRKGSNRRGKGKGSVKNKEYSVFQACGVKVPCRRDAPAAKPIEDADSESGSDSEESDSPSRDLSDLVEEGIEIQCLQCTTQGQVKNKNHNIQAIAELRCDLRNAIEAWRKELRKFYPTLRPLGLSDYPENDTLELPSSFTIPKIHEYGIADFAQVEYTVRLGIAYDTIDDIRTTIHIYNASKLIKRNEVFGQGPATRAWTILNGLKNDIRECAKRYQQSYHGLCRLGLPESSELREVTEQDLWGKDMSTAKKKGDSKREEPWFWVIGKPSDVSDEQWKLELDRVRWFRTRAFRDRLQEEVEILCAEFQRVVYSFSRMDSIWRICGDRKASEESDESLVKGYRSFAYQQADMYRSLAEAAYNHWLEAQSHMSKPSIHHLLPV